MTDREAMQMALEDICGAKLCEMNSMSSRAEMLRLMDKAIEALRQALAQPEQNKPLRLSPMYEYGHIHETSQPEQESISTNDHLCAMLRQVHDVLACTALPMKRPWVGLTDDEIHGIIDVCTPDEAAQDELNDFAKAIFAAQAKLKEKNNAV